MEEDREIDEVEEVKRSVINLVRYILGVFAVVLVITAGYLGYNYFFTDEKSEVAPATVDDYVNPNNDVTTLPPPPAEDPDNLDQSPPPSEAAPIDPDQPPTIPVAPKARLTVEDGDGGFTYSLEVDQVTPENLKAFKELYGSPEGRRVVNRAEGSNSLAIMVNSGNEGNLVSGGDLSWLPGVVDAHKGTLTVGPTKQTGYDDLGSIPFVPTEEQTVALKALEARLEREKLLHDQRVKELQQRLEATRRETTKAIAEVNTAKAEVVEADEKAKAAEDARTAMEAENARLRDELADAITSAKEAETLFRAAQAAYETASTISVSWRDHTAVLAPGNGACQLWKNSKIVANGTIADDNGVTVVIWSGDERRVGKANERTLAFAEELRPLLNQESQTSTN
jgi:hypothetical protein